MLNTASDRLSIRTHDNVDLGFSPAGIATRFIGYLVDGLVYLPVAYVVYQIVENILQGLYVPTGSVDADINARFIGLASSLVAVASMIIYLTLAEGLTGGRTIGKMVAGTRTVRLDGSTIGIASAFIRGFTRTVFPFDLLVGPLMIFFNPKCRRMGDILAGTMVIRERTASATLTATAPSPQVFLRVADGGSPIGGIDRLGTKELTTLRAFVARGDLHPMQRMRVATDLAIKLATLLELAPDAPERFEYPESFVERVYLQLSALHAR